ncbi:MAG: Druantia anti-phage system protein DruA, partial [Candidatus Bipolaricaulia bacterium]
MAQYLCQELDLRDPVGKPRLAGVHKALRVLESRGYWQLPEPLGVLAQRWQARRLDEPVASPQGVPWRVEALKGLQLVEVSSQDDELFRIWNELMLSEHPLHNCRLVGRQLRYLIGSDHGWLGGMGLGSCALRFKVRDRWLGWDEPTRKSFQERLINLTRFLIRPQVQCQNLASRVLSLCLDRVGRDFAQRYGFEPWWVETFVDRERYSGTCFRAANWVYIGASQ